MTLILNLTIRDDIVFETSDVPKLLQFLGRRMSKIMLTEKNVLKIIRGGVYAALFLPFLVIPQLFFPFVTSRGFLFQIIVEIIFALYIALVLRNRNFLPQKTILFYAVAFYFAAIFLSTIFGLDVYRSFFGNYERMWGFFQLLHFFLFFVVIAGIFKTAQDWQKLIKISVFVGALSVAFGLFQFFGSLIYSDETPRISGTIGNPAFLASYLFFIFSFSVLCFFQFSRHHEHVHFAQCKLREGSGILRYAQNDIFSLKYLGLALLSLFLILSTATRGSFVGLATASIVFVLLALLFYRKSDILKLPQYLGCRTSSIKIVKVTALVYLTAVTISIALLFSYGSLFEKPSRISQNQFYSFERLEQTKKENGSKLQTFERLLDFSIYDPTTQTRLITWRASLGALNDFSLFGIGPENFNLAFNKYFNPEFYTYVWGETWFDRAHNVYIDQLVMHGWLGFAAYLFIFGAAFYYLFSLFKKGKINFASFAIFTLLFAAYAAQNIFLFDSFAAFLMFILVIAYLNSFAADSRRPDLQNVVRSVEVGSQKIRFHFLAGILVIAIAIIYFFNIKPLAANYYLARAESGKYNIDQAMELYKKALAFHTFGDNEARSRMALAVAREVQGKREQETLPENLSRYLDEAIAALKTNIGNSNQYHLIYRLQLADLYNLKLARTAMASEEIENIVKKSIEIAPGRLEFEFALAQAEFLKGDFKKSVELLESASTKNPNHPTPYWKIAQNYQFMKETDKAIPYFEKALYLGHKPQIPGEILWAEKHYVDKENFQKIIFVDNILLDMYKDNPREQIRLYQNIALSYAKLGKKEKAKEYAVKVVDTDPSQKQIVDQFLQALE